MDSRSGSGYILCYLIASDEIMRSYGRKKIQKTWNGPGADIEVTEDNRIKTPGGRASFRPRMPARSTLFAELNVCLENSHSHDCLSFISVQVSAGEP